METLRTLGQFGYKFVIITNQQGIGKGLLPEATLNVIHSNMLKAFLSEGIRVDGVFYSPHTKEDDCFCRKPKAGLFYKAQSELGFNIDFENSYFVGDSPSDILAGKQLSLKTIPVANDGVVPDGVNPTHVVKDISEIISILE
jgi:histidinol-phosphate phosphatase family protein